MGVQAPQIAQDLKDHLGQLDQERMAEHEEVEARYERKAGPLREAIRAFEVEDGQVPLGKLDHRPVISLSISDEKLEKVRRYIKRHPTCRQSEIVKGTKLNSGTVSVALRRLEQAEEIQRGSNKDNGSQVWEWVPVPASAVA